MFDSLTDKFSSILNKLRFKTRITEKNIRDACEEVRVALIEADVNYAVAREFVKTVSAQAVGFEVIKGVDPAQQFVKIVHEEMVNLLGPTDGTIHYRPKGVTVIMMAGLQGAGKTTTCAKLAKLVKSHGRQPLLVAADVQRPAAIEQLKKMGEVVDTPVHFEEASDPVSICRNAVKAAAKQGFDTVILDTAGRLHIDEELMQELEDISSSTLPSEIFLVVDAMVGQDAVNSAKEFNDRLEISGVILTKLDGDARGGSALSVKAVTGKPIKFVGLGEKIDQFEEFHADRMAGRILGMGDILSLVEKAQENIDKEEAEKMQERLFSAQFTMDDMLTQFRQVRKMGSMKDTLSMIPGMSAMTGGANIDDRDFARYEAILSSMTPGERTHPEVIRASRLNRIAKGSGTTPADVLGIRKQYLEMKKLFSGKGKFAGMFSGLLGNMGIKLPGGKRGGPGGGAAGGLAAGLGGDPGGGEASLMAGPSKERRKELRNRRKKERRNKRRKR